MKKSCISTFYGHFFDPTAPSIEDIDILDIAHALSFLSRANGHFKEFYSVARHSLNAAYEAKARGLSKRIQLFCLLHDAAESYIGDLTRPLRVHLPEFIKFERQLQTLIFEKYATMDLTEAEIAAVREIDDALLYHEFLYFRGLELAPTAPLLQIQMTGDKKTPLETKEEFLNLYASLKLQ